MKIISKKFLGALTLFSLTSLGLLPLFGGINDAQAGISLSLLAGINDTLAPSQDTGAGFVGGADLDLGLVPGLDLMIGGEYLSRQDTVTVLGITATGTAGYFHIPAILFLRLSPLISVGAGGFYDAPISSGAGKDEGLTGALRIGLGMSHFFIEGRYNYGLDTTDWSSHTSELQGFLGLSF